MASGFDGNGSTTCRPRSRVVRPSHFWEPVVWEQAAVFLTSQAVPTLSPTFVVLETQLAMAIDLKKLMAGLESLTAAYGRLSDQGYTVDAIADFIASQTESNTGLPLWAASRRQFLEASRDEAAYRATAAATAVAEAASSATTLGKRASAPFLLIWFARPGHGPSEH